VQVRRTACEVGAVGAAGVRARAGGTVIEEFFREAPHGHMPLLTTAGSSRIEHLAGSYLTATVVVEA
jgi:hypothetical protein